MRDVSPEFLVALTGGHQVVTRVDAWYDGALVAADLPVLDGAVSSEENALIRASLKLDLAVPLALVPTAETDALAPYGQELHVRRGIKHAATGLMEFVSLGWFRIQSSQVKERWRYVEGLHDPWVSSGAVVSIDAFDRMVNVADSEFLSPESPQLTGSAVGEIKRLVRGLTQLGDFAVADKPVPTDLKYDKDRGDAVMALAAHLEAVAYVDPDGLLVVREVVTNTPSVFDVDGGPTGSLIDWKHTLSRDGVFNAMVVRGKTAADAPVQAVAMETAGPTRWDGPYGRVPTVIDSPAATLVVHAMNVAKSGLASLKTALDVVIDVTCLPHPALECGDYVRVFTPRGKVKGRVVGTDMPLTGTGGAMGLKVLVSRAAVWELYGMVDPPEVDLPVDEEELP